MFTFTHAFDRRQEYKTVFNIFNSFCEHCSNKYSLTALVSWFETSHTKLETALKLCITHFALCSQPVCPSSQDRDFCLLHPEDPLFQTFSGETLRYKGNEPLYPFFINECAYYEKGIALSLARKRRVMIPAIRVQTEQDQQPHKQRSASEEEEWGWTWRNEINDY